MRPTSVRIASTVTTALRTGELPVSKQSSVQNAPMMVRLFQLHPALECDNHLYQRPSPRTVADLKYDVVIGSSSSLSRSSLSTLPAEGSGVTLRAAAPCWKVRQATQRLSMVTTQTSVRLMVSTVAELISEDMRHRCLSVHSEPGLFLTEAVYQSSASCYLCRSRPHFKVA